MRTLKFLLILLSAPCFSQTAKNEVNEQVWKPFIKSFNARQTKEFMDVHSKDVVRAPRDSRAVWNWNEYYQQQERNDKREREGGWRRELELRFTERIYSGEKAIEVGIYKTSYIQDGKPTQSYYGRFHVVLRKENGTWKILVDTDSTEGNTVTEASFQAAQPME